MANHRAAETGRGRRAAARPSANKRGASGGRGSLSSSLLSRGPRGLNESLTPIDGKITSATQLHAQAAQGGSALPRIRWKAPGGAPRPTAPNLGRTSKGRAHRRSRLRARQSSIPSKFRWESMPRAGRPGGRAAAGRAPAPAPRRRGPSRADDAAPPAPSKLPARAPQPFPHAQGASPGTRAPRLRSDALLRPSTFVLRIRRMNWKDICWIKALILTLLSQRNRESGVRRRRLRATAGTGGGAARHSGRGRRGAA
jgi:hypothetical protein